MDSFEKAVIDIGRQLWLDAGSLRRHAIRPIIDEREYTVRLRGEHARVILEYLYGKDVEDQIRKEFPVHPDYTHYEED